MENEVLLTSISGFCRDVENICSLLGYYAASCGNCLPMFRDNVWVPSSRDKTLDPENGTDTLSRIVGKQLPQDASLSEERKSLCFIAVFKRE
jgi:hypothetical protein